MSTPQAGILAAVPNLSRYLEFSSVPDTDLTAVVGGLASRKLAEDVVIGIGPSLVQGLKGSIELLRTFPSLSGPGCEVPSTQADIWCWIKGDDRGEIAHTGRSIAHQLQPAFRCSRLVDGFSYDGGRDLSGYEDGTENPEGELAFTAAITEGAGAGLDGPSFVAVQQWVHDLDHFEGLAQDDRDNIIGRRRSDNEELDDAPISVHVKRTAQESFDPEAFVVRRSMPWADAGGEGLMFAAFGESLDPFEAQLKCVTGQEDGVVDGLFRFTRPVSGSYFWCPPALDGALDLSALGM